MRNRPARGGRAKAKAGLQGKVVDLVNHAINIIAQIGALGLDRGVMGQQVIRAVADFGQRIGDKAKFGQF